MLKKIKKLWYRSVNDNDINYKTVQKMQKQENTILLDVRSHQEYEEGHLSGAISLSLYSLASKILKIVPNKQTTIIVYCTSGARSKQAQKLLEQLGYENVYNLKDGLDSTFS